jgi:hypothetical protein
MNKEALTRMKARMELSNDFSDLEKQLKQHEQLAGSLIEFVKQGIESRMQETMTEFR